MRTKLDDPRLHDSNQGAGATCPSAVSLKSISKAYKHFALTDISLDFQRGTVAGLIGPNGAGKSTTLRILMGLVRPDSGSVSVLGQPISSNEASAKQDIGFFSDDMRLYKAESLAWHMQLVRSFYPSWDDGYANELLHRFGLIGDQIVKGLSHGQRVKSMLMLILARRPRLLILDEPTNGLDPVAKHEVLGELMRIVEDADRTMIFSSHNTQDVEQISDTITFIDRGRVIASSDRDQFLESWRRIRISVPETWEIPRIDGLIGESTFAKLRVLTTDQYVPELSARLCADGAEIESVDTMTLEEIFVSSVMRQREAPGS